MVVVEVGLVIEDWELDAPEVPVVVDDDFVGLLGLVYRVPGIPGGSGSSSAPDFLDSITTTRRMVGRCWGSDWVHNNPICMQAET